MLICRELTEIHFVVLTFWIAVFRLPKINSNYTTPYFQDVGGLTQHVMFYPRQEIF